MPRCIWIVGSEVMNGVCVRPLPSLLVDKQGIQEKFQQLWIGVDQYRMEGENYVDGLYVSIRADFFEEEVGSIWGTTELSCAEGLASC